MKLWTRLFGRSRDEALPLYNAIVARGRADHWYLAGGVPDTLDGRFDMIATVLAVVLLRLEEEAQAPEVATPLSVQLTERFVDDMDAQLRQIGIGDLVVGKQMGKMMSLLGGRLGAYRDGFASGDLGPALVRNLYRGAAPGDDALAHVAQALSDFRARLAATPIDHLAAGDLP
nr:ubiquinol-cytochrome C chaperone family protein [Sphingomonas sp. GV3]